MSSVHSQASDTPLHTQDQAPEISGQMLNEKTPAIKEEEETTDVEATKETKPPLVKKKSSLHSSPNSSSSSHSNGNSNRSVSTITFEKQKVIPHRARTQSAQSVLSSISLRSLLHQNNVQNQQQQQHQNGEQETTGASVTNFNQQIQSPALSSIRKRGLTSHNSNNAMSGAAASATAAIMFRRSSSENEIGLQLPFTDDKRKDLDSPSAAPSKSSQVRESVAEGKTKVKTTEEIEDDAQNEDADSQRRLTTQALRKLSNIKSNGTNPLKKTLSDRRSTCQLAAQDQAKKKDSSEEESDDGESASEDSLTNYSASMTHLKFGNKKVVLDSLSFNPNGYSNKPNSVARPPSNIRKHSLDVIRQPNTSNSVGAAPRPNNKRSVRQITNPKKPLYTPAVLRDISETNITIDDVIRPASPQHTLTPGSQSFSTRRQQSASSQASINSAHSSILESCRRHISSFFFPSNDQIKSDSHGLEAPAPPTRDHWLPDSKRSSCHYCHKIFTFLERKHHCRHCGDIFCQQHLAHWLYLNSNAEFMIGGGGMGTLSKICDNCLGDYENLLKNPSSTDGKALKQPTNRVGPSANLVPSQPGQTTRFSGPIDVAHGSEENAKEEDDVLEGVVGSVPADWNWSSF